MPGQQRHTRPRSTSSVGAKVTSFFRSLVTTHNDLNGVHAYTEPGNRAIDLYRQLHRDSGISVPERGSSKHKGENCRKRSRKKCGKRCVQKKIDVEGFSADESKIPGNDTLPTRESLRMSKRRDVVLSEVTAVDNDTVLEYSACVEPKILLKSKASGSSSPDNREDYEMGLIRSLVGRSCVRETDRSSKSHCSSGNVNLLNNDCIRNEKNNRKQNVLVSVPFCTRTSGSENEVEAGPCSSGRAGTQGKVRAHTCTSRTVETKTSLGDLLISPSKTTERMTTARNTGQDGCGSRGQTVPILTHPTDPLDGLEELLQDLEAMEEPRRKFHVREDSEENCKMGLQQSQYGRALQNGDAAVDKTLEKFTAAQDSARISTSVARGTSAGPVMDRAARRAAQEELSRELDSLLALIDI
ncbi:uncharacterized protein LOC124254179 [Haliotis rubra]|uniref:uncharacterized protein LOC124254179 n=1 Tax=Haliotis rubra TaxID=36100 RepID=UPI001EE57E1E|nr:uncharacterized protein LOC124254179 [Haliotis rubra]